MHTYHLSTSFLRVRYRKIGYPLPIKCHQIPITFNVRARVGIQRSTIGLVKTQKHKVKLIELPRYIICPFHLSYQLRIPIQGVGISIEQYHSNEKQNINHPYMDSPFQLSTQIVGRDLTLVKTQNSCHFIYQQDIEFKPTINASYYWA